MAWDGPGCCQISATIVESDGATGFAEWSGALRRRVGMGRARLLAGQLGLVLVEPAFEEGDGGAEVVVERDEQVDVVEVFLATEAVGQVVAWVDGGAHFAAARTDEAEVAFADLGRRPLAAESGDGDGHGQVVTKAAEQVGRDHGLSKVETTWAKSMASQ